MNAPRLSFFCELAAEPLRELFADPMVIDDLRRLGASVSLGVLDLSPERVDVVRRLNQAGVPVVAWLLLPEDQGYWPNVANAERVVARYDQVRAWSAEHDLHWAGVGLDVEFDQRELKALLAGQWSALPSVLRRVVDGSALARAIPIYAELVRRIRADGFGVDSYVIPLVADERRVGSTLLQRVGGLVDVPADREVPMLYFSSFLHPRGPGVLWSYGKEFRSAGVGSTGGGVTTGGIAGISPLTWDELSRDLRLARELTDDIHVFSLEGCVRQGFLDRLLTFDWSEATAPPTDEAAKVDRFRARLRALLWIDAHALEIAVGTVAAVWLLRRVGRRPGRS